MNEKNKPSFTRKDLKKAVLKEATEHPITMSTTALGIIAGAGMLIFGTESIFLLSTIGLIGTGLTSFGYNYFLKKEFYESKYLEKLQKDLESQNEQKIKALKENLSKTFNNGQDFAHQGSQQMKKVDEKVSAFLEVLNEKFQEDSITHRRYIGSVSNVVGALLDNLKKIVAILRASDTINLSELKKRIRILEGSTTKADKEEKHALEERKVTLEKNLTVVDELLSKNERALTMIDKVTSELSMIDTSMNDSTLNIEEGISDLENLTMNTKNYNNN